MNNKMPVMSQEDFVYSRIGMALISAQRVEFIAGSLLGLLAELGHDLGDITSTEFLQACAKSKNTSRRMLGQVFGMLKLSPAILIEDELDSYLKKRNRLVHGFWTDFLHSKSVPQMMGAVEFCRDVGQHAQKLEAFFKGFGYHIALELEKKTGIMEEPVSDWKPFHPIFMNSIEAGTLSYKFDFSGG